MSQGRTVGTVVVALLIAASTSAQTLTFQSNSQSGIANTLTRSCSIRENTYGPNATVVENDLIELGSTVNQSAGRGILDFPLIVGTGPQMIPPGAVIQSATLQLYCVSAGGGFSTARTVTASFVGDYPQRVGTWREPATFSNTPQLDVGVNWISRDSSPLAELSWNGAANSTPTFVVDPFVLSAFPLLNPSITVVPSGNGGWPAAAWHSFNLKDAVQLWAYGASNQGVILGTSSNGSSVVYASDDHSDPTKRPKLVVTYTPMPVGGFNLNRVPRNLGTSPSTITTAAGIDVSFALTAIEDDAETPEYVLLSKPAGGKVTGILPYLTYRPNPGFSGTDSFRFTVRDAYSTAYPFTVTITVNADAQTVTRVYQEGLGPTQNIAMGETRACGAKWSVFGTVQNTYEEDTIRAQKDTRQGFVHFPNLIGTGAGQIPPGSSILTATLDLRASTIANPGTARRIFLQRIIDPLDRGILWWEPETYEPDPTGGLYKGVSHLYPDARTAGATPLPPAWHVNGGDVHTFETSGFTIDPDNLAGDRKEADVTAAVRAWAAGQPNLGWTVRNASSLIVYFDSDDHPTAANRPKLTVTYRAPGATAPAAATRPRADAGPDLDAFSFQTVLLESRASFHPQNQSFDVAWVQTAGSPVQLNPAPQDPPGSLGVYSRTPRFTAPAAGATGEVLDFLLIAFDAEGDYTLDTLRVTVMPQPGGATLASPSVDAGPDQTKLELSPVTVTATAVGGTGGYSYLWTKLSGPPIVMAGTQSAVLSFQAPPIASATKDIVLDVAVTDLGATVQTPIHDTITIHVDNSPNQPPVADAGENRTEDEKQWIVLDASNTVDPEGHPLSFTWTQTQGPAVNLSQYRTQGTPAARRTPFRAPDVGANTTFAFTLQATDLDQSDIDTVTITVRPQPIEFYGNADSLAPYRQELTYAEARHLLKRLGSGIHPDDVKATVTDSRAPGVGLQTIVFSALQPMDQLAPEHVTIYEEAMVYAPPITSPWAGVPALNQPFDPYPSLPVTQVEAYWYVYALRSPRPMHEKMVRFWHSRLAASSRNFADGRRHWAILYADMLRFGVRLDCLSQQPGVPLWTCPLVPGTGPFGNYREILLAFAHDPATLAFIDGFDNLRFAPNENFAREFMELHTLGIFDEFGTPIYTEQDVQEAARAFTGWRPSTYTITPSAAPSAYPTFVPFFHDYGPKVILGSTPTTFDEAGVVDRVLNYDGGDNAARWLARGLLETFVTAQPSAALIAALKNEILADNWEIAPILQTLLTSEAMFSTAARRSIVRSPTDAANMIVRTLRIPLQTRDIAGSDIAPNLRLLGERLGNPIDVNGFPEDLEWIDEFGLIRRSELFRKLLLLGRTPSVPSTINSPPTAFPDQPGHSQTPVDLADFMPPEGARFADETMTFLLEALDLSLKTTPTVGTDSEYDLARDFLDFQPSGAYSGPFDGDNSTQADRVWSALLLLFEHPEFLRQ